MTCSGSAQDCIRSWSSQLHASVQAPYRYEYHATEVCSGAVHTSVAVVISSTLAYLVTMVTRSTVGTCEPSSMKWGRIHVPQCSTHDVYEHIVGTCSPSSSRATRMMLSIHVSPLTCTWITNGRSSIHVSWALPVMWSAGLLTGSTHRTAIRMVVALYIEGIYRCPQVQ